MPLWFATFGVQYDHEPHPRFPAADPDGYVSIEADTEDEARQLANDFLGPGGWSMLYRSDQLDRGHFPAGCLESITSRPAGGTSLVGSQQQPEPRRLGRPTPPPIVPGHNMAPGDLALVTTALRIDPDGCPNLQRILASADIDTHPWPIPRIELHELDPIVLASALAEVDANAGRVAGIRGPGIIMALREAIRDRIGALRYDLASWPRPPHAAMVLLSVPAPRPEVWAQLKDRGFDREHPDGPGPVCGVLLEDQTLDEAVEAVQMTWRSFSSGGPGEVVPPGWVWSNSGELSDALAALWGCRVAPFEEAALVWRQVAATWPEGR